MSKLSLPTKPQGFFGSLGPSWALLKNDVKKQHLMSELLTKVQLRKKLLFPVSCHPKLVLSNQSRECRHVQGRAKSLGDGVVPGLGEGG